MGHKVPPLANRLGYTKTWNSRWFSTRQNFGKFLSEDIKIRRHLTENLENAAVAQVEIERTGGKVRVIIHSGRPGIVIGRRGADIDRLRDGLHKILQKEVVIDIKEIKNPIANAQLIAENIGFQLKRQINFRRAMKRALQLSMDSGLQGIKIRCSGRLGGIEMSRVESYKAGKVPLSTFRADIEYGFAESATTYGRIGIKVWVYKGDALLDEKKEGESVKTQVAHARENVAARVPAPAPAAVEKPVVEQPVESDKPKPDAPTSESDKPEAGSTEKEQG